MDETDPQIDTLAANEPSSDDSSSKVVQLDVSDISKKLENLQLTGPNTEPIRKAVNYLVTAGKN